MQKRGDYKDLLSSFNITAHKSKSATGIKITPASYRRVFLLRHINTIFIFSIFESANSHFEKCMEQIGKTLIIIGIILVIAGAVVYFAGNKFNWFGHLPGDINIVRENVRIFIPITTMILISAVISVILYIIRRLF